MSRKFYIYFTKPILYGKKMACPTGFEPVIFRVGVGGIIRLCYGQEYTYTIIIITQILSNKLRIKTT